jgi:ubiquitin carboxyl-terminal hydrolase 25/28
MAASAIVDAYDRQVSVDPGRAPLYLQCLKAIATLRGGEDYEIIDQAVQNAYLEGKYTDDDVVESFRYFGLKHNDYSLTEDTIIGNFYAYLSSTSPEKENESRKHLWRIGASRDSDRIKAASEDRVSTVEQAQVFLGVEDNTPDDFIITMYTAKLNDNPSCKDLAYHALKLIAEGRKSEMLNHYLATGETLVGEMDIGDAYRLLQIPDRTADDGAIMAAYTICVDENPGQADRYNRALAIIAKNMDSPMLRNMAGISSEPDRNLLEWPVGLQNIGNTCYLNSLLQFYFSVRPFRNLVLHFEKHQMDVNDESTMARKQVGSRKVAKKEVERSLKCKFLSWSFQAPWAELLIRMLIIYSPWRTTCSVRQYDHVGTVFCNSWARAGTTDLDQPRRGSGHPSTFHYLENSDAW